jgi:hypothetical protein
LKNTKKITSQDIFFNVEKSKEVNQDKVKDLERREEAFKDLYKKVAPVAYNGYIKLKKEDTEVIEALRVLREAGFFDYGQYVENSKNVSNPDKDVKKLQEGDYELLIGKKQDFPDDNPTCPSHAPTCPSHAPTCPSHAPTCPSHAPTCPSHAPTCPSHIPVPNCPSYIPTPTCPSHNVNPSCPNYSSNNTYVTIPGRDLIFDLSKLLTYADIEYATDILKYNLPTEDQIFFGYTAKPKFRNTPFDVLGPRVEYGGSGLDENGNKTGMTMEEYLDNAISKARDESFRIGKQNSDQDFIDKQIGTDIEGEKAVSEPEHLDSHTRGIYEMLMADGDKPDLLSELLLPLVDLKLDFMEEVIDIIMNDGVFETNKFIGILGKFIGGGSLKFEGTDTMGHYTESEITEESKITLKEIFKLRGMTVKPIEEPDEISQNIELQRDEIIKWEKGFQDKDYTEDMKDDLFDYWYDIEQPVDPSRGV